MSWNKSGGFASDDTCFGFLMSFVPFLGYFGGYLVRGIQRGCRIPYLSILMPP